MSKRLILIVWVLLCGCGVQKKLADPTSPPIAVFPTTQPTLTTVPLPTSAILPTNSPVPTNPPLATATFTVAPVVPTQTTAPTLAPTQAVTTFTGQVGAGNSGLRLRQAPNTSGTIITSLDELTPLVILGRSGDNGWLRVTVNGNQSGWVMSQYVTLSTPLANLPIVDGSATVSNAAVPAAPTADLSGAQAYVVAEGQGVRLRAMPSVNSEVLATVPEQTPLQIIGRVQDNSWLQVITPAGAEGWVFAQYIRLNIGLDSVGIPDIAFLPTPTVAGGNYALISGVTSNSVQIFLRGQSMGNRASVFAKVGDSITATWPYLYPIGWGDYNLRSYSGLSGVVSYFRSTRAIDANSFASVSMAARGGWQTSTVLGAEHADVPPCEPGEMPLVCEYRLTKPSVALIMLGSNDQWIEPTEFQANLQRIVEITIEMGIIPALSTIPPTNLNWADKVPVINGIITNTARAYDIPLWDFYSAMVPLPNQGLSSDGVHPSTPPSGDRAAGDFTTDNLQYGYTVRNLLALQMLDAIWRQVIAPNEGITPPSNVSAPPPAQGVCAGMQTRLAVGMTGRVTPGDANNLRAEPSTSATKIGSIPPGSTFSVLAGPICADNLTYWQVNYNGAVGWTAEGRAGTYWVEPVS